MVTKLCATFHYEDGSKQVINMCDEAYHNMAQNGGVIKHLNGIKFDLGATNFSFEVFPD